MSIDLNRVQNVLEQQHRAIDMLMARIISMEPIDKEDRFMPTQSGPIWDAVVAGQQLLKELKAVGA